MGARRGWATGTAKTFSSMPTTASACTSTSPACLRKGSRWGRCVPPAQPRTAAASSRAQARAAGSTVNSHVLVGGWCQPEVVPFRLTANMVDVLGVTGTHGVFSEASEVTMNLLREKQVGRSVGRPRLQPPR